MTKPCHTIHNLSLDQDSLTIQKCVHEWFDLLMQLYIGINLDFYSSFNLSLSMVISHITYESGFNLVSVLLHQQYFLGAEEHNRPELRLSLAIEFAGSIWCSTRLSNRYKNNN